MILSYFKLLQATASITQAIASHFKLLQATASITQAIASHSNLQGFSELQMYIRINAVTDSYQLNILIVTAFSFQFDSLMVPFLIM